MNAGRARLWIAAIFVCVSEGVARAQENADTLELAQVLASLEAHYPTIEMARQDRAAADGEALAADGGFDPSWRTRASVSIGTYDYARVDTAVEQPTPWWGTRFFAGYRLGRGSIPLYYGELGTATYGELRAGLQVPLWRDGPIDRRRANIDRAELGQSAAALSIEQLRLEVTRAAAQRYWDWVGAGLRLHVAERLLSTARVRDAQIAERVRVGDLPNIEHVENQRAIVQREGQVVSATRSLEQMAIELSMFWRDDAGEPRLARASQLPASVAEPPEANHTSTTALEQEAISRRPDARRVALLTDQFRVERRWAENQRAPAIDLMAAGSHDFGSPLDPSGLYGPQFEASITLDIPLLNRTATGRTRVAEAGIARLEAQREFVEDRIRADVRDAASAMNAAQERLRLARRELGVARELLDAEMRRFELGDTTLLIVNLREQAAAEAEVREVDALVEFHRAEAALAAATARAQ